MQKKNLHFNNILPSVDTVFVNDDFVNTSHAV